jgi:hypothetical protein
LLNQEFLALTTKSQTKFATLELSPTLMYEMATLKLWANALLINGKQLQTIAAAPLIVVASKLDYLNAATTLANPLHLIVVQIKLSPLNRDFAMATQKLLKEQNLKSPKKKHLALKPALPIKLE